MYSGVTRGWDPNALHTAKIEEFFLLSKSRKFSDLMRRRKHYKTSGVQHIRKPPPPLATPMAMYSLQILTFCITKKLNNVGNERIMQVFRIVFLIREKQG